MPYPPYLSIRVCDPKNKGLSIPEIKFCKRFSENRRRQHDMKALLLRRAEGFAIDDVCTFRYTKEYALAPLRRPSVDLWLYNPIKPLSPHQSQICRLRCPSIRFGVINPKLQTLRL